MTTRTKSAYAMTAVGVCWLRSRRPTSASNSTFGTLCYVMLGVLCGYSPQHALSQGVPGMPTVILVGAEKDIPKKLPPIAATPSIDSLLRLAYQEEQAKHPWLSINAYRKALELPLGTPAVNTWAGWPPGG